MASRFASGRPRRPRPITAGSKAAFAAPVPQRAPDARARPRRTKFKFRQAVAAFASSSTRRPACACAHQSLPARRRQLRAFLGHSSSAAAWASARPGCSLNDSFNASQSRRFRSVTCLGLLRLRLELGASRRVFAFERRAQRRRLALDAASVFDARPSVVDRTPPVQHRPRHAMSACSFSSVSMRPASSSAGAVGTQFALRWRCFRWSAADPIPALKPRRKVGDQRPPLVQIEAQGVRGLDGVSRSPSSLPPLGQLVTVCCRASASLRSRPALSSSCSRSESSASSRPRSSATSVVRRAWQTPPTACPPGGACSASASCRRASLRQTTSSARSLVAGLAQPALELVELLINGELVGLRLLRRLDVGQQPLALGICAASCSACRVADSASDCSRSHNSVTSPERNRTDAMASARRGGRRTLELWREPVSRPGPLQTTPLAAHRAVEEGLAGLPFLGGTMFIGEVPRICSSDCAPSMDGPAGLMAGKVPSLLTRVGTTGWLSRTAGDWLRFDGRINAHGWGPRSFAHGIAMGRKYREDYLSVPHAAKRRAINREPHRLFEQAQPEGRTPEGTP